MSVFMKHPVYMKINYCKFDINMELVIICWTLLKTKKTWIWYGHTAYKAEEQLLLNRLK